MRVKISGVDWSAEGRFQGGSGVSGVVVVVVVMSMSGSTVILGLVVDIDRVVLGG